MKYHFTGCFWMLDHEAKPFLSALDEQGKKKYFRLERNKEFKINNDYGRKCIGFWQNNTMNPCPKQKKIEKWSQCDTCRQMDHFNVCAKCDGTQCNADEKTRKACLNTPHFLYLTLIGDLIKVGITRSGRYLRRWIEQGSDYACLIGSGNGQEIRQKEKKISQELPDRVYTKQKIEMFKKDNQEILKSFLESKNLKTVQVFDVHKYYKGLETLPVIPEQAEELDEGRIVCIKGKIMVFEKNNKYYYYNLNRLKGRMLDFELS